MTNINLLTVDEVADILKINARTVRKYCYEGKIEYIKIGKDIRISEQAFKNYLQNSTITNKENESEEKENDK